METAFALDTSINRFMEEKLPDEKKSSKWTNNSMSKMTKTILMISDFMKEIDLRMRSVLIITYILETDREMNL
jgi:hypothetical protein